MLVSVCTSLLSSGGNMLVSVCTNLLPSGGDCGCGLALIKTNHSFSCNKLLNILGMAVTCMNSAQQCSCMRANLANH